MTSTLSQLDLERAWVRFQDRGDVEARNQLIEHYLPLVKLSAEKLWGRLPRSIDVDDLVSAGVFGLLDALRAFNPHRKVKFTTYCVPRVRGAMLDYLRAQDWVPRLVRMRAARLAAAVETLESRLGRAPTDRELGRQLQAQPLELAKIVRDSHVVATVGLSDRMCLPDSERDVRVVDTLVDARGQNPRRPLEQADLRRLVCRGLNREERLIVLLYYFEDQTFKHIGSQLGLSESRVSQIHSALMRRLKSQLGDRRPELFGTAIDSRKEGAA